jgi:hypothetical protein
MYLFNEIVCSTKTRWVGTATIVCSVSYHEGRDAAANILPHQINITSTW